MLPLDRTSQAFTGNVFFIGVSFLVLLVKEAEIWYVRSYLLS